MVGMEPVLSCEAMGEPRSCAAAWRGIVGMEPVLFCEAMGGPRSCAAAWRGMVGHIVAILSELTVPHGGVSIVILPSHQEKARLTKLT
jgi:hypothetical protein